MTDYGHAASGLDIWPAVCHGTGFTSPPKKVLLFRTFQLKGQESEPNPLKSNQTGEFNGNRKPNRVNIRRTAIGW